MNRDLRTNQIIGSLKIIGGGIHQFTLYEHIAHRCQNLFSIHHTLFITV